MWNVEHTQRHREHIHFILDDSEHIIHVQRFNRLILLDK